jgi:hypothetical protein
MGNQDIIPGHRSHSGKLNGLILLEPRGDQQATVEISIYTSLRRLFAKIRVSE